MPIQIPESISNEALQARSYEVTLRQVCEDHHVFYRASANVGGRTAQAYGNSPEAALSKLYDEVIPELVGLRIQPTRPTAVVLTPDRFASRALRR